MKAIQMVTVGDVPVAVTAAENAFAVTVRLRCRTRRGRVIAAGFLVSIGEKTFWLLGFGSQCSTDAQKGKYEEIVHLDFCTVYIYNVLIA